MRKPVGHGPSIFLLGRLSLLRIVSRVRFQLLAHTMYGLFALNFVAFYVSATGFSEMKTQHSHREVQTTNELIINKE